MGDYAIVRTDNMQAVDVGILYSAKYYAGATPVVTAIENGMVVKLSELLTGEREIYKAIAPEAVTDRVVLVAGVELIYDESTMAKGLDDFINPTTKPFRCYSFYEGDEVSISDSAITAIGDEPEVGNYLVVEVGEIKLKEVVEGDIPATARFIAQIIEKETLGTRAIDLTVFKVLNA
jgi:hypothetical protein